MKIVARYSIKGAESLFQQEERWRNAYREIENIIESVDCNDCLTKISQEKGRKGVLLYDPKALNQAYARKFTKLGWKHIRVSCEYSKEFYVEGYQPKNELKGFREMDFVKDEVGVEVQFGKYAFMAYNVCAKMTIFEKLGYIKIGVEIVPVKDMASQMPSGISSFEQFAWDLQKRGEADIDIPVLILGVTC